MQMQPVTITESTMDNPAPVDEVPCVEVVLKLTQDEARALMAIVGRVDCTTDETNRWVYTMYSGIHDAVGRDYSKEMWLIDKKTGDRCGSVKVVKPS